MSRKDAKAQRNRQIKFVVIFFTPTNFAALRLCGKKIMSRKDAKAQRNRQIKFVVNCFYPYKLCGFATLREKK